MQEQHDPFLSVCTVFSCVPARVWLPVFVVFNMRTGVAECGCTQGLYGHYKTKSKRLRESALTVTLTEG